METVLVTFRIDADDPNDKIGLSEERYLEVHEALSALGGDDIEFTKESDAPA